MSDIDFGKCWDVAMQVVEGLVVAGLVYAIVYVCCLLEGVLAR